MNFGARNPAPRLLAGGIVVMILAMTFAGAMAKTNAGGEINVVDAGGYGTVTITKAITIANDGVGTAGVLASVSNGITISAGISDVVVLRGLDIEGLGTGLSGIKVQSAGVVHVVLGPGFGLHLVLTHDSRTQTLYGHLSAVLVKEGYNAVTLKLKRPSAPPVGLTGQPTFQSGTITLRHGAGERVITL